MCQAAGAQAIVIVQTCLLMMLKIGIEPVHETYLNKNKFFDIACYVFCPNLLYLIPSFLSFKLIYSGVKICGLIYQDFGLVRFQIMFFFHSLTLLSRVTTIFL